MTDHADEASRRAAKVVQDAERRVKRRFVERPEAFVQKERLDPQTASRKVRESEREREAHDEAFAPRKVRRRADRVGHVVVDHRDLERGFSHGGESVAALHHAEHPVGRFDQDAEGDPLRDRAKTLSLGVADEFVQGEPALSLLFPELPLRLEFLGAFAPRVVGADHFETAAASLFDFPLFFPKRVQRSERSVARKRRGVRPTAHFVERQSFLCRLL